MNYILGLCGYPLCDKPRQEVKHKGRYHISLKDKKVYDLQERNLFCSDTCFRASDFYKSQLNSAPLWLRESEMSDPVTIYHRQAERTRSDPTERSGESPSEERDNEDVRTFTTPADEGRVGARKDVSRDVMEEFMKYNQVEENKSLSQTVSEALEQWFTIESFRIIYGDDQLKLRLREAGSNVLESREDGELGGSQLGEEHQAKYRDLCRKLDLMDLLEEQEEAEESQLLPLPSYEILRQHCLEENSKMGAFLDGKQSYRPDTVKNVVEKTDNNEPRLPLIDHMSQIAYRRRLVSDSLQKTLPDILKLMNISLNDINTDLKDLIESFQISATTVVFKSEEWTLIAIIILKLISVKKSSVSRVFSNDDAIKYVRLILLSYQLDLNFVEQVIRDVTCDIARLLSKYQIK